MSGDGADKPVLRNSEFWIGFDELAIGDAFESAGRTVTQAEVSMFAGVSGDFNQIHMNHDKAADGPFRQPIAHGLLVLSIASGLGIYSPKTQTVAFLSIENWEFLKPVFFGDTIYVRNTVIGLEPRSRGRRGIVTWTKQVLNHKGQVVQQGTTKIMIKSKHVEGASDD
ncbi:MAG: MaoC/PaaZ C-terminal domain-containing protein [Isosphaeraceae bacterium]